MSKEDIIKKEQQVVDNLRAKGLPTKSPSEQDIWETLCSEIDQMAMDVNSTDFGLPFYDGHKDKIIDFLKSKYSISKK